nr:Methionine synthase [Candidatus Pantoea persica]
MVNVAKEMERQGFTLPLLIGVATTSKAHTAVKIEQNYSGPTVYVQNASRTVGVVSSLLSPTLKANFVARTRKEYDTVRVQHACKKPRTPPVAHRLGVSEITVSIDTLRLFADAMLDLFPANRVGDDI